jgi:hypothetical protein
MRAQIAGAARDRWTLVDLSFISQLRYSPLLSPPTTCSLPFFFQVPSLFQDVLLFPDYGARWWHDALAVCSARYRDLAYIDHYGRGFGFRTYSYDHSIRPFYWSLDFTVILRE